MTRLGDFLESVRADLPRDRFARWASVCFSLSVLTILISLAAAQTFLFLASALYAVYLLRVRERPVFPPVKLPLALFCLLTVVSVFLAANSTVGWFAVRKLVLFLILLLGMNLIVSARQLTLLSKGLFLESALAGLVAAVQFVVQYRTVRAEHPGKIYLYMTMTRIRGFMGHWMNFGGQQMLVFAVLVAFLVFATRSNAAEPRRPQGRGWWWLVLAIVAGSLVLNFTRGVWLGCFVATLYLLGCWKPRWLWVLPVLVVAGFFASPRLVQRRLESLRHPSADPSLSIRFEMWRVGLRMIERHPLVGVGPNNIVEVYTLYLPPGVAPERGYREHLHDNFIQLGAERGLPCLAAWIWLMVAFGWHIARLCRRLGAGRWVALGAFAGWLAFLTEGCFEFNFGTSPVLMLFLFVATTPFIIVHIESAATGATKTS